MGYICMRKGTDKVQEGEQSFQGTGVGREERGESKGVREGSTGSAAACGGAPGRDLSSEETGHAVAARASRPCFCSWRHTHGSPELKLSWTLCLFRSHRKQVLVELDVPEAYREGHHVVDRENLLPTAWASLRKEKREEGGWVGSALAGRAARRKSARPTGAPEGRDPVQKPDRGQRGLPEALPAPLWLRAETLRVLSWTEL